jgi:mono/diheme cytochrome c family protein
MIERATLRGAALVLGVAALLGAGCDEDAINPMAARQPKVQNYRESDFYSDGLAMREPPAGTVPRERVTGIPGIGTGKVGEQYLTQIPIKVDQGLLSLGRRRYDITCGTCHGPLGDGDSVVGRQMALRPPPSLHLYKDRPVGYLFEVATKGFGLMASYAAELPVRERWAVVAYIQALQLSQSAPVALAPPEKRADLDKEPSQ